VTAQSIDNLGGLGIGVVQPQSGLDYPFVSPGKGDHTSVVSDVENLFADFYLSYDDSGYYRSTPVKKHPLRVHWLYGFGTAAAWTMGATPTAAISTPTPTHAADLLIVDADNNVVFNSVTASSFDVIDWGALYKIYEWRSNAAVCRAVKYEVLHNNQPVPNRPIQYCPRNAVLDERAIEKAPKHVLAMRVKMGECVTPFFRGKVSLVNGYNTEIDIATTATENLRRTTPITFTAGPGLGAGQYGLCPTGVCEEDNPTNVCPPGTDPVVAICGPPEGEKITTINGVKPNDAGNIFLTADDCMWVRKPATYAQNNPHNYKTVDGAPVRSVMAIGADCSPCCACSDYLEVAKYMTRLGAYYQNIGGRVTGIKAIHESNISRWEQQLECRARRPFELMLIAQPCPCMDVIVFYCNHCDTCAENVSLTVQFSATPGVTGATLNNKYSRMVSDGRSTTASISGGWPVYRVGFPTVAPGSSTYAQFRLCFCPQYPYAITGKVTGSSRRGPILAGCTPTAPAAIIEASQILDCEPILP
jgi:hypothetical protein